MPGQPKTRARKAAAAGLPPPAPKGKRPPAKGLSEKLAKDVAANGEPPDYEAWQRGLTDAERYVEKICDYMMNGQWLGGASVNEVAKQEALSPETVRRYAAEANRLLRDRLRRDPELAADARYEVLQNFRIIRAAAMATKEPAGLGVALNANRALGFYLGVEPVKRLDVADVTPEETDDWNDQELEDFARTGKRPRRALRAVAQQLTSGELGNGASATNGIDGELTDDDDGDLH